MIEKTLTEAQGLSITKEIDKVIHANVRLTLIEINTTIQKGNELILLTFKEIFFSPEYCIYADVNLKKCNNAGRRPFYSIRTLLEDLLLL